MSNPHRLTVVGMGLDGLDGLTAHARSHLESARVIAGSPNYLTLIETSTARQIVLTGNVRDWLPVLQQELDRNSVVLLASGDPLFFGIGRLLIKEFAPEQLEFHPHLSSIQLAFSRLHLPWQDAEIVSIHGRSLVGLERAIKQGKSPIAVLTDSINTPSAIARLIQSLHVPAHYKLWVGSQLGSPEEAIASCSLPEASDRVFPQPNVVVLQRQPTSLPDVLPLFGLDDGDFVSFSDRPGLMTKQEVRALSLMLLQLEPNLTIWDVGAGTGSLSIEIARLVPTARVLAIEKTAAGIALIEQNCQRFQVANVEAIAGEAPDCFAGLPQPNRIVLGGGGTDLPEILQSGTPHLAPKGAIVAHFATLEACVLAQNWLQERDWQVRVMQVNIARAVPIAQATRWSPLNPVMLLQGRRSPPI
ncbi:MAG: precorrin-6y C5,15-methyltransferase (decarboxylating) subunit CbiE [Cyanobacteria bacterium P01_D01_bin.123]